MTATPWQILHLDARSARDNADKVLVPLWEATHEQIIATDAFYSTARILDRLDGYTKAAGFAMTVARDPTTDTTVGLAFGYPLPTGSRWWQGLLDPTPEGFTDEDGTRTFAINEIMVHPSHQRRGIAALLHTELLSARPEERATLLVRHDNHTAHAAYNSWGWHKVARLQPYPDSPIYDALILPLPLTQQQHTPPHHDPGHPI